MSRSQSGPLPPARPPHARCCSTLPSSDSPRALWWRQEHLAQGESPSSLLWRVCRKAVLIAPKCLSEGLSDSLCVLRAVPLGATGAWRSSHECAFPLFIPLLHLLWASSPVWSSREQPQPSSSLLPFQSPLFSTSTFQQLPVWHLSSVLAPQVQWDIWGLFSFKGDKEILLHSAGPLGSYSTA